jgi:predicted acylesterase/phospholipase RssA
VPYWDGGYLGNPVIFPFFGTTQSEDVLVVQINPLVRQKTPTSAGEIMNRLNEITFNSPLIAEYRAMEFVARLIDQGRLPRGVGPGQYRRINVHRIVLDRFGTQLDASSRLTTDYDFRNAAHQQQAGRASRRTLCQYRREKHRRLAGRGASRVGDTAAHAGYEPAALRRGAAHLEAVCRHYNAGARRDRQCCDVRCSAAVESTAPSIAPGRNCSPNADARRRIGSAKITLGTGCRPST